MWLESIHFSTAVEGEKETIKCSTMSPQLTVFINVHIPTFIKR
jgi:hypothetical protein